MSVDTTSVSGRRIVKFNCINCLKADLDRIQSAHDAETLKTIGNWTAGQILQHDAKFITFAMDGVPFKAVWFVNRFFQLQGTQGLSHGPVGRHCHGCNVPQGDRVHVAR